MIEIPDFKPNSRKCSMVFASMNFDEAYEHGKTSMMTVTDWFKRYKNFLGGLDSRLSTLGERLNKTETKDKDTEAKQTFYYETYQAVYPLYNYEKPTILLKIEKDTFMTPTDYHNTNWNRKMIWDSIRAVETIKKHAQ